MRVTLYARVSTCNGQGPEMQLAKSSVLQERADHMRGRPCNRQTVGLLQRRHVRIDSITPIGKESNNLEGVEAGVIHSDQEVYTVYTDPERDEWTMKIQPALKLVPLARLVRACKGQISRRALIDLRAGRPFRSARRLQPTEPGSAGRDLVALRLSRSWPGTPRRKGPPHGCEPRLVMSRRNRNGEA
jgi:hypothetical protein